VTSCRTSQSRNKPVRRFRSRKSCQGADHNGKSQFRQFGAKRRRLPVLREPAPCEARQILIKHERTKRTKRIRIEWVSLVVDVAVCCHFARFIASILVFLKARSLRSLTCLSRPSSSIFAISVSLKLSMNSIVSTRSVVAALYTFGTFTQLISSKSRLNLSALSASCVY